MDLLQVFGIILSIVAFAGIGAIVYVYRGAPASRPNGMRGLMPSSQTGDGDGRPRRSRDGDDEEIIDVDTIKERTGHSKLKTRKEDTTTKLFKAGFFSPDDRKRFQLIQLILPPGLALFLGFLGFFVLGNPGMAVGLVALGIFAGFTGPISWLERRIRRRKEDTLYYLPLVIEQISIGVSSSLDIGPCIGMVLEMTDARDSHNPVTEMFMHVEKLMRSGLSLEEALLEVSEINGQNEVKHAFLFLAQCSKHGGEISKQLQELADAVMVQRQVYVEGRIAALPVTATMPLAVVFSGFFALLFAGLMVRLVEAFAQQ